MDQNENLKRELRKCQEVLGEVKKHLGAHAEMNAALHCATEVFYSPLHAKVTSVLGGVKMALGNSIPSIDPWVTFIEDLDRCEHGRHQEDSCDGCGGLSIGNPHLIPGFRVGYDCYGEAIEMPRWKDRWDPNNWRPRRFNQQIPQQAEAVDEA